MSETPVFGQIQDAEKLGIRDAIHVAAVAVRAGQKLAPGQDVGLDASDVAEISDNPIGIVDPFLKVMVYPDQVFWLFLYPGTITGLRHHWSHRAMDNRMPEKTSSEEWLKSFANRAGMTYDELLDHTENYIETGFAWTEHNSEKARDAYYDSDTEFWDHYERVTGKRYEGSPFSCSC